MSDARRIAVELDYGTATGSFVRLDIDADASNGKAWQFFGLSPDEADALAERLHEVAAAARAASRA